MENEFKEIKDIIEDLEKSVTLLNDTFYNLKYTFKNINDTLEETKQYLKV